MTEFEKKWHDMYMLNMVSIDTLRKLADAGKLTGNKVDEWERERKIEYGM